MAKIIRYVTESGKDVLGEWLRRLKDPRARAKIAARLNRLTVGNFGDCKALRDGVWELRIDWGAGYRVYFARAGRDRILLLCGGDKRRQSMDINRAIANWKDYKRRAEQDET